MRAPSSAIPSARLGRAALVCVLTLGAVGVGRFAAADGTASPLDLADARGRRRSVTEGTRAERLAAIRSLPYEHVPERALSDLVAVARGRDATLAPAAAVALYRIAERHRPADAETHDVDPGVWAATAAALVALEADETVRADVRRVAAFARSMFSRPG